MSRPFVVLTERALAEMMATDLSGLDLVALMLDGVHLAEHCCVVPLGISIDATKHPLGVVEGSTGNTTVVTDLLTNLRDRGLGVTSFVLVVIDEAKALASAVKAVFDHPVIHRCQLHKVRTWSRDFPMPWPRRWPRRCAPPTGTPTPWPPRRTWRPWLGNCPRPIREPPPARARDRPRR